MDPFSGVAVFDHTDVVVLPERGGEEAVHVEGSAVQRPAHVTHTPFVREAGTLKLFFAAVFEDGGITDAIGGSGFQRARSIVPDMARGEALGIGGLFQGGIDAGSDIVDARSWGREGPG